MRALIILVLLLSGCGEDPTYLVVKVDKRLSVHDVAKLKISLSNAGSERSDELSLNGKPFPVTFSIAATGRTGELGITAEGLDEANTLVGVGQAKTTIESSEITSLLLDPAD